MNYSENDKQLGAMFSGKPAMYGGVLLVVLALLGTHNGASMTTTSTFAGISTIANTTTVANTTTANTTDNSTHNNTIFPPPAPLAKPNTTSSNLVAPALITYPTTTAALPNSYASAAQQANVQSANNSGSSESDSGSILGMPGNGIVIYGILAVAVIIVLLFYMYRQSYVPTRSEKRQSGKGSS